MSQVLGIGTDIIECLRIAQMIERHGELFINRVYTPQEIQYCQSRKMATQHFAGRWAAKEAILKALEMTPPELAGDIYRRGLYLTGGGALLRGLDKRLSQKIKLPVHVADDPLKSVVRGTGLALKHYDRYPFVMR